jgi:cell wall-associated NlpC family hydrolase
MHWTAGYIGWAYQRLGQGPDVWDCWAFFRYVQRERYGRDLPLLPSPPSWGAVARAMPAWAAQFGWREVEQPRDGDAVFLSRMKDPTHIGVWVADVKAVLHCHDGGSVLHDARHLAMAQWRVRGYFSTEI